MDNLDETLNQIREYADSQLSAFAPTAHHQLKQGSIERMQSFVKAFAMQDVAYIEAITKKANEILGDKAFDKKTDIREKVGPILKDAHNNFIKTYRPE